MALTKERVRDANGRYAKTAGAKNPAAKPPVKQPTAAPTSPGAWVPIHLRGGLTKNRLGQFQKGAKAAPPQTPMPKPTAPAKPATPNKPTAPAKPPVVKPPPAPPVVSRNDRMKAIANSAPQKPAAPKAPAGIKPPKQRTGEHGFGQTKFSTDMHTKYEVDRAKAHLTSLLTRFPRLADITEVRPLKVHIQNKSIDLVSQRRDYTNGGLTNHVHRGALGFCSTDGQIHLAGRSDKLNNSDRPRMGSDKWSTCSSHGDIFRHEFGHHVQNNLDVISGSRTMKKGESFMTARDKFANQWKTVTMGLWSVRDGKEVLNGGVSNHPLLQVSQYSRTNHKELFAESFNVFTHPAYQGNLPAPIHNYFKELLT